MVKVSVMARRIVTGLTLAALLAAAFFGYRSWNTKRSLNSGEVFEDAADSGSSPTPTSPQSVSPALPPNTAVPTQSAALQPPPADSITPNPPNGARFAGSGRFEVYRQGNLTYRIDTQTGTTCILFATHAEWRKPEVYRQGCNTPKS